MRSLKTPEKGKQFKIALHLIAFIIICAIYLWMAYIIDANKLEYNRDREKVIYEYNLRISEKDSINKELKSQQVELEERIDSLEGLKLNVNEEYDHKIRTIYDASAYEHARWLESIIRRLDSLQRK